MPSPEADALESARRADLPTPPAPAGALALLATAQLLIGLDYSIVYVALPVIDTALGFSAESLQWVVSAYAVFFAGLLLVCGRLVDTFGARGVFLGAAGVLAAASLGAGPVRRLRAADRLPGAPGGRGSRPGTGHAVPADADLPARARGRPVR